MRRTAVLLTVLATLAGLQFGSWAAAQQRFGPPYTSASSDPCSNSTDPNDPVGVTFLNACSSAATSGDLSSRLSWRTVTAGTAAAQHGAVGVVPQAHGTEHAFRVRVTARVSGQARANGLSYARMALQLVMGDGAPCNLGDDGCVLLPTPGEQPGVCDDYYACGGIQSGVETVLMSVSPEHPDASVARTVVLRATVESYRLRTLAVGSYPMRVRIATEMYSGIQDCPVHALDSCFGPGITPAIGMVTGTARILSVTVTPTSYRSLPGT